MLSLSFLSFFLFFAQALAFQFSFKPPSECDDLGLTWTGGSPPFSLYMTPVFGTPRNVSIPASAFSNGKGSLSLKLPFKKNVQVLFTMSDSTGFNAGGSSNVYTVLQSKGGVCNATDPATDFVFQLNSNLQQCRPFTFSGYDGAIPPVTIGVIIPGGTSLIMSPPVGQPSYDWLVNVARGTSMLFFMSDSQGRQGGSSDIRSVGASDDSGCLDSSSPSTTANAPGPNLTQTSATALPSFSNPGSAPPSSPISAASIAGAIIGSVLFLAVVITLGLFILKRRSGNSAKESSSRVDLTDGGAGSYLYPEGVSPYGYPSLHPPKNQFDTGSYTSNLSPSDYGGNKYPASEASFVVSAPHVPAPALYPPQPHQLYSPPTPHISVNEMASPLPEESELPYANPSPTSPQQSSAVSSWQTPTTQQNPASKGTPAEPRSRYILHTDAEDEAPDEGVIELPPQYSERQGPGRFNSVPTYDTKHPL